MWLFDYALTPVGRVVGMITAACAGFFGWLALHDHNVRVDERTTTIAAVNEGAKKLDEKGNQARAAAAGPGAADWLRKHACRDCP